MAHLQNSAKKCAVFNKRVLNKEFLCCSACNGSFHLNCCQTSERRFYSFYAPDRERRDRWKCLSCTKEQNTGGNNVTAPARSSTSPGSLTPRAQLVGSGSSDSPGGAAGVDEHRSPPPGGASSYVTHRVKSALEVLNNVNEITEDGLDYTNDLLGGPLSEMKEFMCEMRAFRGEMSMFRATFTELSDMVKAQNSRMDLLEARIVSIEEKKNENHLSEISYLQETILQLKTELRERDQEMLSNDIELAGFPEVQKESGTHVILTVAKKLGVEIEERDVVSATRVGAPRLVGAGGAAPRPRPLAVRLARRAPRDALLQAARVRRRLDTDGMGLTAESHSTFFVNERLTKINRQLFQKTREIGKSLGWKYMWTRDGKIFARQENGKARHQVRCEDDLVSVFGTVNIGPHVEPTH